MATITTQQAADTLGVTRRRVLALIKDGRLPAEKMGRDWLIAEKDLERVADRKPGRPVSKTPAAKSKRTGKLRRRADGA